MNAPVAATSLAPAGWQGKLSMSFEHRPQRGRSVLASVNHHGPLRVQRPFHPEGEVCHVYMLHPPGGVVGGDGLAIRAHCEADARALLTTPGATKFYRSAGEQAQVQQTLRVDAGASLEWLPQENIFFPGARVQLQTEIQMQADASLLAWEINCLGRPVIGERFDQGQLGSHLRVSVDGTPLLLERQRVANARHLAGPAGLRDAPVQGVLLAWKVHESDCERVQALLAEQEDVLAGATLLDGLLVVRALGHNSERLRAVLIGVWGLLRPVLLGKPALLPRIWAT